MSLGSDIAGLLRGLSKVTQALASHQQKEAQRLWRNSSLKSVANQTRGQAEERFTEAMGKREEFKTNVQEKVSSVVSGASNVVETLQSQTNLVKERLNIKQKDTDDHQGVEDNDFPSELPEELVLGSAAVGTSVKASSLGFESPVLDQAEVDHDKPVSMSGLGQAVVASSTAPTFTPPQPPPSPPPPPKKNFHYDPAAETITFDTPAKQKLIDRQLGSVKSAMASKGKPLAKNFSQELGGRSKERKVPGTRLGRLVSFGSLAAGLGVGAIAEVTRRGLGITKDGSGSAPVAILDQNPFLTEANAERIVNTLCRVRGAALKLGQMLSIQDNSLINPELQAIFERVRQSADFMPGWQMEKVLYKEIGADWKEKLDTFDDKPFAAASIGQVHRAKLHDGRDVAMKIQYPGVADSINSDINNLMSVLKVWQILPEGLYADAAIKVARKELAAECDYIREAECSERFRELVKDDPVFYVPEVIQDLTTKQVLTSELVSGVPLDKVSDLDQSTRNWICENILRLVLTEVFVFRFMQTDPNWANFLYDKETNRLSLLDFGASREYSKTFVDSYIKVIKAASLNDRQGVLDGSVELGFLTGYESKLMQKAHVDTVMILGEAFAEDSGFDFGTQSTAARVHNLIPVMLKHRLTAPPEESYSLHRKMAGCFLLCSKLHANINCKPLFDKIWSNYRFQPNLDEDIEREQVEDPEQVTSS